MFAIFRYGNYIREISRSGYSAAATRNSPVVYWVTYPNIRQALQ